MTDWEWDPGEPIYSDPRQTLEESVVVRPIFQIFDEDETEADTWRMLANSQHKEISKHLGYDFYCAECLVSWRRTLGPICWNCGRKIPTQEGE